MAINSTAILTRALPLHRAGQLAAAASLYREVLQAEPRNANALHLLGLISRDEGNHAHAVELFSEAIAVDPEVAPFRLNRGLSLRALGRASEAMDDFRRAGQLDATLAEAFHQEGNILRQLGRLDEAIAALRKATQLQPTQAPVWLNLGVALLEHDEAGEAAHAFRQAIAIEPTRCEAHNILGVALLAAGQFSLARAAFVEALRLNSHYAAAHDNLGRLDKSEGHLEEAIRHFRTAVSIRPEPSPHSNLLLALNYTDSFTPEVVFAEHRRWHQLYAAAFAPPTTQPKIVPRSIGQRLRIGYVSPDFNHHAVSYFIAPVLAAHDRTKVEVFCYASVTKPDRTTERLRGLTEHWRDIARLDDEATAALVRADKIDLLIDLAGHTAGNRLLVFARRPAPFQATWLGYPNTTGLDAIDYRLTDAVSDPVGETDGYYSEKLIRLPTNFSCYDPDPAAPPVNALPATKTGTVTFGSFNNFAKVTPEVIALWARLLGEIPTARLLLKSRGFGDPSVAERIKLAFASHGISPQRLDLNGMELSVAEHLGLYHSVDIALDPFPYNGTTTTCEALWMGVPVLTLAGRTHAGRVGASLLTHLGLTEWIADSPDKYVELARAAAGKWPELAALRLKLRDRMQQSSLCNAGQFTRGLELAYLALTSEIKS